MRGRGGEREGGGEREEGRRGWEGKERGGEREDGRRGKVRREESYGTTYIEASKQTLGDFRPGYAAMESDNGI